MSRLEEIEKSIRDAVDVACGMGWGIARGVDVEEGEDPSGKLIGFCCALGAVAVARNRRIESPADFDAAAQMIGMTPSEGSRFVDGFDSADLGADPPADPALVPFYELGQKLAAEYTFR